jgi:hypothetical protein
MDKIAIESNHGALQMLGAPASCRREMAANPEVSPSRSDAHENSMGFIPRLMDTGGPR